MKPLVFLDVDGVVNDLEGRPGPARIFESHGYMIRIPEDIIIPVQKLVEHNEVMWLTTWRENANEDIRKVLGIPLLEVITDGTTDRYVGWKWKAALTPATRALNQGRHVWWIEDFYGHQPTEPSAVYGHERFHFIDTWGSLQPHHLHPLT